MQNKLIEEVNALTQDDETVEVNIEDEKKQRRVRDYVKDELENPSRLHILTGLNQPGMHVYGGTVPAATVEKRRKKNKAARAARRKNR